MEGKKRKIRRMRKAAMKNSDGTVSSHRMEWTGDPSKKRGKFGVHPSITPKEGRESSTNPKDWKSQTAKEAKEKGELIEVKSRRRAQRLAAGAWKKGKDRREAMRNYRKNKQH
jgi:hypothetical protein